MIIKFFGRKSSVNESRIFYNGGHYLWWPKIRECWVRSSSIGWILSYEILYDYSTMYYSVNLVKLCVWKLILRSRIAERLIFAASNVRTSDTNLWETLSRKPCKFWCDWRYFFYNFRPLSIAKALAWSHRLVTTCVYFFTIWSAAKDNKQGFFLKKKALAWSILHL